MPLVPATHDPAAPLREHQPVEAWRAAVAAIAERHALAGELAPFATGSDVVWAVGERVVKLTAPRFADELAAEARWAERHAGRLSVATPELVASGELEGWPYVVVTRVPGVALADVWPALPRAERARLAADLGALVAALHAEPLEPGDGADWPAFLADCRSGVGARHARRGAPAALADEVDPFLARVGPLDTGRLAPLHTELLGEHVLVAERGGRPELAALIDWADARVGEPLYDLTPPVEFVFRGEAGVLRAFLLAYGFAERDLDAALAERLLAWSLTHRFGHLGRLLRAALPDRPATLPELARRLFAY